MKQYNILLLILMLMAISSCSSTSNLPQDETLYAGIKELTYGHPRSGSETSQEGVITAIADAYNKVENILEGKNYVASRDKKQDSIKVSNKLDAIAYNKAKEEVEAVLSYAPNNSLMGSSFHTHPLPIRLWIYNRYVNSNSRFGKWMFNSFSEKPIYISTVNPDVRTHVAQNTLRNHGYFYGKVNYDTIPTSNPRKNKISYHVEHGNLYHLDSIAYQQFPHQADSLIHVTSKKTFLHKDDPFNVANLNNERIRLCELLRNYGYFYFRPEYIKFRADTLQTPLKVQLQIRPSSNIPEAAKRQYYLGKSCVRIIQNNQFQFNDTLKQNNVTLLHNGGKKPPVKMNVFTRYLSFPTGMLYRQKGFEWLQEKLSSMNAFSQVNVNFTCRDTLAENDTLDIEITAVMDKPYDAEFEGKLTSKSNGQIGPGASFTMSRNNAFRGAETVSLKLWGSYEWQTGANIHGDRSLLNSYEYGANLNLSYPRFLAFGLGKRMHPWAQTSTNFMIDAKWMNRANYFGRVSIGARVNWTYQAKRNAKHDITPFRLDYDVKLSSTSRFDSIVNANEALYVSMRNQFIPSMEYTYSWVNRRHAPRTFTLNVKEAGNVTSTIYAMVGKPFYSNNKEFFGVPFAQYVKCSAQYTHIFRLTPRSSIATRLFGGAIICYGNSTIAPYNDQFVIGGANSIRAFAARSIGPGSYHPKYSHYSYIDEMGDLKFEANVEYRFPIIANLYGATFVDAGNVWLMHPDEKRPGGSINLHTFGREIALGTGAGLRYDLDFLVIRFDLGIGLHAPYDTGKHSYYNMKNFGHSLGYHLAIGYPF